MTSYINDYLFFMNMPPSCKNFIDRDMADVPKSLESLSACQLVGLSASPHEGFEGCLP